MVKPICGDCVDGNQPLIRECTNPATRISHIYEDFSVYVCDLDHEGLEPWTENDIESIKE